jgi:hypothetical protein
MRTAAALLVLACAAAGLRIGVVGALQVNVAGAVAEHGTLASVASDPLVRVDAGDPATRLLRTAAAAHPATHFALVGGPAAALHLANVVGLVIRDDEAALLGGVAAGLSASEQSGPNARVAWVGPEERSLASAFARGVHTVAPKVVVLRVWSPVDPASCKEAALEAVARGASAVMAHAGECASAAIAAAHERNSRASGCPTSSCRASQPRGSCGTRCVASTTGTTTSSSAPQAERSASGCSTR